MYLLSIEPVKDLLLRPPEDASPPFDPGGSVRASPEAGGDTLSDSAPKRAVSAFSLRASFTGPYIASGGRVFDYGQEADVAGRLLVSPGLPAFRSPKKTESRNTRQNARNTAPLFGYKIIILITSAYHMRREVFCFANNGFRVVPALTAYLGSRASRYNVMSLLPSADAFSEALREYAGPLYYRLAYP
jgi:uncharacterized SAM-binding protein YcdF (DUF218 family)